MYTSLAALCLAASACAPTGVDRTLYTDNVCRSGTWDPLAGVTLSDSSRYLELWVTTSGGPLGESRQVASRSGTRCAIAPDPAACERDLTSAAAATGWQTQRCGGAGCTTFTRYFVTERAGVVATVTDADALAQLVVPVDSGAEAALVAAYRFGVEQVECASPQVRANDDGSFEVLLASGDGDCTDRTEARVRVAPDGTATVLQRFTRPAARTCISPQASR